MTDAPQKTGSSHPRVLFVSTPSEDYLADGLFHGLRGILGDRVVDYPRIDSLYKPLAPSLRDQLYGRGFTLYGLLEDIPVNRHRIDSQVAEGKFDAVVFANIHGTYGRFVELLPFLDKTKVAVLDGADSPALYPYSGTYWRRPYRWFLPRAHTRFQYFKREWTPETLDSRFFRLLPRAVQGQFQPPKNLLPTSFSIPAEKIVGDADAIEKTRLLPSHIVDAEVKARLDGATESYAFDREEDYYRNLQISRFGITVKRAGWDCLRHYEIAANGTVPCFRDLGDKPPQCAPHGLNETNSVAYSSADELFGRIEAMGDDEYHRLQRGALAWARASSTVARATQLLHSIGLNDV